MKKDARDLIWILLAIVALLWFASTQKDAQPSPPESRTAAVARSLEPTATDDRHKGWQRHETIDRLTNKPILTAKLYSLEPFELPFPYQGQQWAWLEVRDHPRMGHDIMLKVERGQFVCPVSNCAITVSFDDGAPQRYLVDKPSDHSTETLFISNAGRFDVQLKKARQYVTVEANFYRNGLRTFEFPIPADK